MKGPKAKLPAVSGWQDRPSNLMSGVPVRLSFAEVERLVAREAVVFDGFEDWQGLPAHQRRELGVEALFVILNGPDDSDLHWRTSGSRSSGGYSNRPGGSRDSKTLRNEGLSCGEAFGSPDVSNPAVILTVCKELVGVQGESLLLLFFSSKDEAVSYKLLPQPDSLGDFRFLPMPFRKEETSDVPFCSVSRHSYGQKRLSVQGVVYSQC